LCIPHLIDLGPLLLPLLVLLLCRSLSCCSCRVSLLVRGSGGPLVPFFVPVSRPPGSSSVSCPCPSFIFPARVRSLPSPSFSSFTVFPVCSCCSCGPSLSFWSSCSSLLSSCSGSRLSSPLSLFFISILIPFPCSCCFCSSCCCFVSRSCCLYISAISLAMFSVSLCLSPSAFLLWSSHPCSSRLFASAPVLCSCLFLCSPLPCRLSPPSC
jgi:hypothetical protein